MNKYSYLDPALTEILAHPIAYPKALNEVKTATQNYNTAVDKLNNYVSDMSGIPGGGSKRLLFAKEILSGDTTYDNLNNSFIDKAKVLRDKSQNAANYTNLDNTASTKNHISKLNEAIASAQDEILQMQIARGLARGGMGLLSNVVISGGDMDGWDALASTAGGMGGGLLGSHIAELNNLNKTQKALLNVGGSLIGGPAAAWLRRRLAY